MAGFSGRVGSRNNQKVGGLRCKVDGKPRPKQWKKSAMLEWLINNPIATLGDGDGTTRDADCMFLRYQMGEMKKLRTDAIDALAQQQTLLEGNWVGPDPIIRLFHCIIDHAHIMQKFLTRLQSMSRLSLENRNSDLCRDISVWEDQSCNLGQSNTGECEQVQCSGAELEEDHYHVGKEWAREDLHASLWPEFAAASGDNVRVIYDAKRAQLKEDEDDDASSMSSKQTKSEMFIGGSIMKLANNNVMIAQINAQEKEKDRQEKEKDRLAAEELHKNKSLNVRRTVSFNKTIIGDGSKPIETGQESLFASDE
eukprot:g10847.t1 g10847   contig4:2693859-2695037(-)